MSNLLNKNGKRKLLDRGPQIKPPVPFKLDELDTRPNTAAKTKEASERKVTSVRVKRSTQHKLNALVSLNKADTIDELVNNMVDEYLDTHITKDEKKQYDIVMELYRMKK